jgi:N-dimethylarginine dimethylaminohydrolase
VTDLSGFNEYGALKTVVVRSPLHAFVSDAKIDAEWQRLGFRERPDLARATDEYDAFTDILRRAGAEVLELGGDPTLTLDAIYTRDALLVSPKGLVVCRMGRMVRRSEPTINMAGLKDRDYDVVGVIGPPGMLEAGDLVWLNAKTLAVGKGPRTNIHGIRQLRTLLGPDIDMHVVSLPPRRNPDEMFHLMSIISPLDRNLALIYRPLMPRSFLRWLSARGIRFVEVPKREFASLGCDVLALGPRNVLMLDRLPITYRRLLAAGCAVQTYKGDDISRMGGGGPTCLTRPLVRG